MENLNLGKLYGTKDKMKLTGCMTKTCLESLLGSKVEYGYSYGSDTMLIVYLYEKNDEYNYCKFEMEYEESKDEADYCAEVVRRLLTGAFEDYEASCEERYIIQLLDELECENLWVIDGELIDNENMSVDITCLDVCKFDKIECNLILIDKDGCKFEVDLCQEKILAIEDK